MNDNQTTCGLPKRPNEPFILNMSETLKRTPLYEFHRSHGARLVPFAGWEMPVQYSGILEEHRAVREKAGLFDVSHMGEARVSGKEAEAFLNYMMANDVSRCAIGQAIYSTVCQEDGGVLDDVIIYRLAAAEYFICLNASNAERDVAWLKKHSEKFAVTVSDESAFWGQLALQGPKAKTILQGICQQPVSELPKMGFTLGGVGTIAGVVIARTGYTGEDGYELYVPAEQTEALAVTLLAAGRAEGLQLCGLGARDSLRLEAGLPLYGHELTEKITPLTAGLGWSVKLDRQGDFVGKRALTAEKANGLKNKVIFYTLGDKRIARQGTPVYLGARKVGEVLSGSLSPLLNLAIGSALVETAALAEAKANGQALEADIRGTRIPLSPGKPLEKIHKSS